MVLWDGMESARKVGVSFAIFWVGALNGVLDGNCEGAFVGKGKGALEGNCEGMLEGEVEGAVEGVLDGVREGIGVAFGFFLEGAIDGTRDGLAVCNAGACSLKIGVEFVAFNAFVHPHAIRNDSSFKRPQSLSGMIRSSCPAFWIIAHVAYPPPAKAGNGIFASETGLQRQGGKGEKC